jgi:hypothetical protein
MLNSGLESQEYGRKDPLRWPGGTIYQQMLQLTSPTSGGCWVGIVRSRTQATEFRFFIKYFHKKYKLVTAYIMNVNTDRKNITF